MTRQEFEDNYMAKMLAMITKGDRESIIPAIDAYPEVLQCESFIQSKMWWAASDGNVRYMQKLKDRGISVNISNDDVRLELPLNAAVLSNRVEAVRWLVENGSLINYALYKGDKVLCFPLIVAIMEGNFEIVKLLVEAGAYLNVIDKMNQTPLDCATGYGHTEIADYLRFKGALEADKIPGYVHEPENE